MRELASESSRRADRPKVAVLDYGSGNLHSATRALEAAGADVVLTADTEVCLAADGLVVPGVGAFAACMDGLI
ncbi:MAG TPA: imidazole glycerol phosphate synthase subunit HisH, partial [Propionicimonas sp.]|nr:imidazole glycerol phosphate synthase subunit HisH [Propionicimonas sp.]